MFGEFVRLFCRLVNFILISVVVACASSTAFAETSLVVDIGTGADDLRGESSAAITIETIQACQAGSLGSPSARGGCDLEWQTLVSSGRRGLHSRSVTSRTVSFAETVTFPQIRSIKIRYNGKPHKLLQEPDKWDLQALQVYLMDSGGHRSLVYNSELDSAVHGEVSRFAADHQQIELLINNGLISDLVIQELRKVSDTEFEITVRNRGQNGVGVASITCSGRGGTKRIGPDRSHVGGFVRSSYPMRRYLASGRVRCEVLEERLGPSSVTSNDVCFGNFPGESGTVICDWANR